MSVNQYLKEFGKPFEAADVSWRMQYVDRQKSEGFAVPYIDARAISDRLDAVVGQFRWQDAYQPWHTCVTDGKEKFAQLCTISIYDEEREEWICKTDGAEDSDIESIKGGLSDAFKRAAVKWNIGRYLYRFQPVWVKAQKRGGSYVVDESEKKHLTETYNRKVAEIFGTALPQQKKTPIAQPRPTANKTANQTTDEASQAEGPVYEIKKVNFQQGNNGNSNSVVVFACRDKQYKAYVRGVDERLKVGAKIKNLNVEQKMNSCGKYNLLNDYELAA